MATIQLQLPDDLKALAEARAAEAGYTDMQEYMEALIRADAGEDADAELEELLQRRLDTGGADMELHEFARDLRGQIQQQRIAPR